MDGLTLRVLNTENSDGVAEGNKTKGQKSSKVSIMGSPPRKRLADISNLQQLSKPSNQDPKQLQALPFSTKEYIEKLHMENMTLLKGVAERNKIIELSGIELQKLTINFQKVQQQNLQLAQANSQMLAELNSGKDRLKTLHHELGCKNALLKARQVVLESKAIKVTCFASGNQVGADKSDEAGKIVEAEDGVNKTCKTKRRRQSKNQSSVSSTVKPIEAGEVGADKSDEAGKTVEADDTDNKTCKTKMRLQSKNQSSVSCTVKPTQAEEKVDDKRLSLRRQSARFKFEEAEPMEDRLPLRRKSARFKCEEPETSKDRICLRRRSARSRSEQTEPVEDLYVIDDAKFPVSTLSDFVVHENGQTLDTSVQEEHKEGNGAMKDEAQESRRRSTGRPSRLAAEKVQSYKEIPLKVKMRREE